MNHAQNQPRFQRDGDDLLIFIKAVPGASRDAVAGLVGDRLKVRVAAPPEGGKANKAICAVISKVLGLRSREVTIESGHASAEKTLRIHAGDDAILKKLL